MKRRGKKNAVSPARALHPAGFRRDAGRTAFTSRLPQGLLALPCGRPFFALGLRRRLFYFLGL
jgi:hypothetical protein